mmetsp:Transcript_27059/g.39592  ORF Transcript_27059/g.39592 Transcript_27059/m.39592 type:complete len:84 (-) Transcript_27059:600-851(-)
MEHQKHLLVGDSTYISSSERPPEASNSIQQYWTLNSTWASRATKLLSPEAKLWVIFGCRKYEFHTAAENNSWRTVGRRWLVNI